MQKTSKSGCSVIPFPARVANPHVSVVRTDVVTAAIVEEGIALLKIAGLQKASEFLSSKMVPLHVARRVLLHPGERRQSNFNAELD